MNNQEPELNPKPDETASAKTNESVQTERSELPVDQQSSYLRSRQIALKKFSPQGGDPSITLLSIFLLIGCSFRKLAVHGVECQAMAAEY